jgi:hypothetical protein
MAGTPWRNAALVPGARPARRIDPDAFETGAEVMTESHFRRPWLGLVAGAALVLSSAAALAGSEPPGRHAALMEMTTAQYYAGYAAKAKNLDSARTNLLSARNCLVGPQDPLFDSSAVNPCSEQGTGAIRDANDPARQSLAQDALSQLEAGLQASDLTNAQSAARQAIQALRMGVR